MTSNYTLEQKSLSQAISNQVCIIHKTLKELRIVAWFNIHVIQNTKQRKRLN